MPGSALVSLLNAISNLAYGASWNGVIDRAPSLDVVYDEMEKRALISSLPTKNSSVEMTTGTDDDKFATAASFQASNKNVRYIALRLVEKTTNVAAASGVGGDFEFPFTGVITEVGAFVDTAGTTNLMTVDIHKGGTTIMTTNKITLDSTEKTSRTAATAPALTTTAVTAGDIFTFDIDGIQTTPAKGLTIWMAVRMT
jgi:hypothetical protein